MGRGSRRSIACAAINNKTLQPYIIAELTKLIRGEVKELCSTKYDSILCMKVKHALEKFSWDRVWGELEKKCPILLQVLTESLPYTTRCKESIKPAMCTSACILLKLRCPSMSLLQGMLSIVLRAGHASKQVCLSKY